MHNKNFVLDPIFYTIYNFQNQRIRGLLEKCTIDHEIRMENLQIEMREKALSDAKWRQIQQDLNQSVSAFILIIFVFTLPTPNGPNIHGPHPFSSFSFVAFDCQSDVVYSLALGNTHLSGDSQLTDFSGEEIDALRGRYICRLTAVIIHHIPAFWKVAFSVSTGKFAKVSTSFYLCCHRIDIMDLGNKHIYIHTHI